MKRRLTLYFFGLFFLLLEGRFAFGNGGFGSPFITGGDGRFGGGGFGGGGFGGGGGGAAQYKPNELTKKILEDGVKAAEELKKIGTEASKNTQQVSKDGQEAINTILNQPNTASDVIKSISEAMKKTDEEQAKFSEQKEKSLKETRESILKTINETTNVIVKSLEVVPKAKSANFQIERPTNGEVLSQTPQKTGSAANLGRILRGRDLAQENAANNTTPPQNNPSQSLGHEGHSHGFKSKVPTVYNKPTDDNF